MGFDNTSLVLKESFVNAKLSPYLGHISFVTPLIKNPLPISYNSCRYRLDHVFSVT